MHIYAQNSFLRMHSCDFMNERYESVNFSKPLLMRCYAEGRIQGFLLSTFFGAAPGNFSNGFPIGHCRPTTDGRAVGTRRGAGSLDTGQYF